VLAQRLVAEAGVLVAPGTAFFNDRAEGDRWLRLTLVRDLEETRKALDLVGDFLAHRALRSGRSGADQS
jgi:aspartate/methionine/tyrosine aminotransferase